MRGSPLPRLADDPDARLVRWGWIAWFALTLFFAIAALVVFTERGLIAWLERRRDDKTVRLQRWYEREVIAPYRRRRATVTGENRP